MFESKFFGASAESRAGFRRWVQAFSEELMAALPARPYAGDGPGQLSALLATDICPEEGASFEALRERLRAVVDKSIALWHPHTAAHLHTPVLLPAVAAELAISALNQSMDSFDQALGGHDFAAMIEWLHGLARLTAIRIAETKRLELLNRPQFGCVVFRYVPADPDEDADAINRVIARELFDRGLAVIGRTKARGRSWLKLTINDPRTSPAQLDALLETIVGCGRELSAKGQVCQHSC
jgi:glutamate/tyrosine decarboxylase-like PLP-dependent enzyme